jgi:hypothetical protein
LRILIEEDCVMNKEIGVLCRGHIFRYSRKRNMADREEQQNEIEEGDTGVILYIEGIPCTEEKEKETD